MKSRVVKSFFYLFASLLKYAYRFKISRSMKKNEYLWQEGEGKKTILFINHFYSQDLKALLQSNSHFKFVVIHPQNLFGFATKIFSKPVRELNVEYTQESVFVRKLWRRESAWFLRQIELTHGKIDLVLTPSDVFYWYRELGDLFREKDIPAVVLDKEGMISPYSFVNEANRIKKYSPPMSDKYFVWSERQKDYWVNKGVCKEKIEVTGQARSDLLFRLAKDSASGDIDLLLFSFHDDAYIPAQYAKEGVSWRAFKNSLHELVLQFSKQFPDKKFVIKAHPQQLDLDTLKEKYSRDNLRVIGGSENASELMLNSKIVVGFQTTSLFEMAAVGLEPIYIRVPRDERYLEKHLLPLHDAKDVKVVDELSVLQEMICKMLKQTQLASAKKKNTMERDTERKYFHKVDGERSLYILGLLNGVLSSERQTSKNA